METGNEKVIPMRRKEDGQKWLRAKEAMKYFQVSRNTLDKIARECDAVGRFGEKVVIYDVQRIEKYIRV